MSGLARIFLKKGYKVSGSDIKESRMTLFLREEGADICIGHDAANVNGADMVVVSSAILGSNPELKAAEAKGIPILPRAEMLARLTEGKTTITVAGTHGKTTTTSMIAKVLSESGLDPTFIIGGELNDIGSNAIYGEGEYLVAEADESDGSLLYLHPQYAVVTNIEADHLDYFGTYENVLKIFRQFLAQRDESGESFICGDDENLKKLARETGRSSVTFGLAPDNKIHARNVRLKRLSSFFEVYDGNVKLGNVTLNVPGEHNVRNALGTFAVAKHIGLEPGRIVESLEKFPGVQRRFQVIGRINQIDIVDDYAHHPTEVAATLKAASDGAWDRVIAVFQPHRFSRTKYFHHQFGAAFAYADEVVITEVYGAGEKPIPGISGKLIVDATLEASEAKKVVYLPHKSDIKPYLAANTRPGDLVIFMGAGDIGAIGSELCLELSEQLKAVVSNE